MPRKRGGHQSVAVSPLDMLEEEVFSFRNQQQVLVQQIQALGGPEDGPELRKNIVQMKQVLAVAENSISNRLEIEVPEEQLERLADLEDAFFELKATYFALLRQCVAAENIRLPQPEVEPNVYHNAPDVQRFGNPHASPSLQNMPFQPNQPPAPLPPRPSSDPSQMGMVPPQNYGNEQAYGSPGPHDLPQYQHVYQEQHQYEEPVPQYQQQTQVQQNGPLSIDGIELQKRDTGFWEAKELVERNEEIKLISSEMIHLQEAFQDVAVEVDVQGERAEEIEENTEQAVVNAKEGVQTLGKSAKNSKKVLLPGAGGSIGGVAGGVAGGVLGTFAGGLTVPGAVVGAAVGAGAGAVVGHGVGKIIRKGNDKDMAKARLNEKWAPDSSTKTCQGCDKKFTQVKRRHHCRNCGGVFCGKCTKHRMHIPGVATESRPRVCRQCFEALMYHNQGIKPPSHASAPSEQISPALPPRTSV